MQPPYNSQLELSEMAVVESWLLLGEFVSQMKFIISFTVIEICRDLTIHENRTLSSGYHLYVGTGIHNLRIVDAHRQT
jgi:hypothetical protein